jgi:putative addiction module component (TIGR02574 family)
MNTEANNLFDQALSLSDSDRAALAASLIRSLETESDSDAEEHWKSEVERRIAEIENGDVELVPWDEVMAKLKSRQ